jgi:hypothetical protein
MTKNNRVQKSGEGSMNRNHGKNQNDKSTRSQLKAFLKIKHASQNKHAIKASFKDSKGNDIKELIYAFHDGYPAEFHFEVEKQLFKLGDCYNLFKIRKWKVLGQIRGRALKGRRKKYWYDIVKGTRNHGAGDSNAR